MSEQKKDTIESLLHAKSDAAIPTRRLGKTGLKVSELCLGAMTFGTENSWGLPLAESDQVSYSLLDRYVELGGNFIDTADIYGNSEEVIGRWLAQGKVDRKQLIIATKVHGPTGKGPNDRGLSRKHIFDNVERSLKRMQTDYIDLFQIHSFDPDTPLEETMCALNDLVRAGKVRYLGCSNLLGWQIKKAQEIARSKGWTEFSVLQMQYHLLCRATEWDLVDVCKDEGMGMIAWSPLAGGWLTGKYKRSQKPESGRVAWAEKIGWKATNWSHHDNEHTWGVLDVLEAIAKDTKKTMAQVSLRWILQKPGQTGPIIGATSIKQLEDNLGACNWELTADQMKRLDDASARDIPYPFKFF